MNSATAPTTESIWRERVRAWRESGLRAEEFAQGRGFAASSLRWWSSRLGREQGMRFVQLVPQAKTEKAATLVIEVGSARVHVTRGFDPTLLADVVRALGGGAR